MTEVETTSTAASARVSRDEMALKSAALDALHERVAVIDVDGVLLTVNAAWRQYAMRAHAPAHARTPIGGDYLKAVDHGSLDVLGVALPAATGSGIRSVLTGERPRFQCEYSLAGPGGPAWFLLVVMPLRVGRSGPADAGGAGPAVVSHIDIVSRRQIDADPTKPGTLHDPLTGLPARTLLRDRLAMSLAQRPVDDRRTAVFVVGLEDVQVISDEMGLVVLDEIFIELVRRMQATLRPGDTIARLGPAQIAFVCGAVRGEMGVQAIRMRLRAILGEPMRIIGHPAPVWVRTSIGAALDGVDGVEPDGLLLAADLSRQLPTPDDAA